MKITNQEILNATEHRPWPVPSGQWKYYQEWNNALFLHWEVETSELQRFVPKELEIDLYEGKAWVSVVLFAMDNIRPRLLPAFPPISNFTEINVRTYVKNGHQAGVYFLSIEGSKRLSCKLAKAISGLPYRYSKMSSSKDTYTSKNKKQNDNLSFEFKVGETLNTKCELDVWLTERYALYQDITGGLAQFELHHLPWEINSVELSQFEFDYPKFKRLLPGFPHLVHYSTGVQVLAWDRTWVMHPKSI